MPKAKSTIKSDRQQAALSRCAKGLRNGSYGNYIDFGTAENVAEYYNAHLNSPTHRRIRRRLAEKRAREAEELNGLQMVHAPEPVPEPVQDPEPVPVPEPVPAPEPVPEPVLMLEPEPVQPSPEKKKRKCNKRNVFSEKKA